MKSKASVRIDWHGDDGNQVIKTAGSGVVVLTTLPDGQTAINAVGVINEIIVAAAALKLVAKAYDKQDDPYIRGLIINGMEGLGQVAQAILNEMNDAAPDVTNPLAN